jgi:hypothetical protein
VKPTDKQHPGRVPVSNLPERQALGTGLVNAIKKQLGLKKEDK